MKFITEADHDSLPPEYEELNELLEYEMNKFHMEESLADYDDEEYTDEKYRNRLDDLIDYYKPLLPNIDDVFCECSATQRIGLLQYWVLTEDYNICSSKYRS